MGTTNGRARKRAESLTSGAGVTNTLAPTGQAVRNSRRGTPRSIAPSPDALHHFVAITKALADENRVRILLALCRAEMSACQIIELVRLAPSTVSKHMSILLRAGLVHARKDGRWVYYRLADGRAKPVVRQGIGWLCSALSSIPQAACGGL